MPGKEEQMKSIRSLAVSTPEALLAQLLEGHTFDALPFDLLTMYLNRARRILAMTICSLESECVPHECEALWAVHGELESVLHVLDAWFAGQPPRAPAQ